MMLTKEPGFTGWLRPSGKGPWRVVCSAPTDAECFRRLQHAREVPRARRACSGGSSCGRAGATADHSGDAVGDGGIDLLR